MLFRSWSLGIADSVTVLARSAAAADAAATLIANAVDVEHPAIERARACDVDDNTDLGSRLVTIGVARLPEAAIALALDRGAAFAGDLVRRGLIWCALLGLQGGYRTAGGEAGRLAGERQDRTRGDLCILSRAGAPGT